MSSSGRIGLSKSLVLKGLQCQKALWLAENPPVFEFPANPEKEARLTASIEVGRLARDLFPGGVLVPFEELPICEETTSNLMLNGYGIQSRVL